VILERSLKTLVNVNLWQTEFWEKRRDLLFRVLEDYGFTSGRGAVLAFQEVLRGEKDPYSGNNTAYDPVEEVCQALGFTTADHLHFFPLRKGGPFGLAILSDLPLLRQSNQVLTYLPQIEDRQRNTGVVELLTSKLPTVVATTQITSKNERGLSYHQVDDLEWAIRKFIITADDFSTEEKNNLQMVNLKCLTGRRNIVMALDLNNCPHTAAYRRLKRSGLVDITCGLRRKVKYTWPVDPEWLAELNVREKLRMDPGQEQYQVRYAQEVDQFRSWQRPVDYIFCGGLVPQRAELIGSERFKGMYPSDHLLQAIYF